MSDKMSERSEVSHLSEEQVEELYQRYISGERNADLVAEYKLSISPNSLIKIFPPVQLDAVFCPYCCVQMYERRKSKADLAAGITVGYCQTCDHKYYTGRYPGNKRQCGCGSCEGERLRDQLNKDQIAREKIREYWRPLVSNAIPYEDLEMREKIYLLSLINAQADLNSSRVSSVLERRRDVWLAPSQTLESEVLELLYRRRIIVVDPESPLFAFDDRKVESINLSAVRWIVNIKLQGSSSVSVEDLQRQIAKEFALAPVGYDAHQTKLLAVSVLTEQVMRQIHYQCARCSLSFTAEKKGRDVVASLLKDHNAAVVGYFVYLAVRRADDYYKNSNVSTVQATNIIPRKLHEYGIKAISEAWDLAAKKFLTNDPRSELNKVVFDLVLRADDGGCYKKIGDYFLALPKQGAPKSATVFSCPVCGSRAVHASTGESGIIVDCKDCIARSPVLLASPTV
ncbi:hypothetical protein D3C81_311780 [compost metagenome]|uniref:hypothetical protein n=1 Tax=Pseudomonas putida TaxID=303 RepID=UPI000FC3C695